jgi:hypothetical protein
LGVRTRRTLGLRRGWEKDPSVASLGDTPPPSLRDVRQCVILTRGDDVPAAFVTSLRAHGIDTLSVGHPLLAFAELLRLERGHRKPSGWGLPEVSRTALIVANRDHWEKLDQLLDAVRGQLPQVAVWVTASNLLLEVRDVPRGDDLPAFPESPQLRLAGEEASTSLREPASLTPTEAPTEGPTQSPKEAVDPLHPSRPESPPSAGELEPGEVEPGELEPGESEPKEPSSRTPDRSIGSSVTPEEIEMLLRIFPTTPSDPGSPPSGGSPTSPATHREDEQPKPGEKGEGRP